MQDTSDLRKSRAWPFDGGASAVLRMSPCRLPSSSRPPVDGNILARHADQVVGPTGEPCITVEEEVTGDG